MEHKPAFRPQKKLLVISSILLAIWIAVLIWIYAKWVWPSRQHGQDTAVEKTH
ncbi:MAG TPA: hypothetical protein VG722_00580 [Tepidisphaeraceae bacterium]|nr:hypothetical protein [Tepidisphaeraceae bacterium]